MAKKQKQPKDFGLISDLPITVVDEPAKQEQQKTFVAEYSRTRRENGAKHWAFISILWVATGLTITLLIIKALYLVLPDNCQWISDKRMTNLDQFLTGAIGGAVISSFKDRLGAKKIRILISPNQSCFDHHLFWD